MLLTDSLVAAASFATAFYLREGNAIFQQTGDGSFTWTERFAPYGALLIFVVVIRVLALRYYDLYRLRGEFSLLDDGIRVFKSTAIGSLLIVPLPSYIAAASTIERSHMPRRIRP